MIFLGDVAHPFTEPADWRSLDAVAKGQPLIVNVEGSLTQSLDALSDYKVFNHVSIIETLKSSGTRLACLANNHIADLPGGLKFSCEALQSQGILTVGAGANADEAAAPVFLTDGGQNYVFVAFGWKTIQCLPAAAGGPGVNPLEPLHVLRTIADLRNRHPDVAIVTVFHWNIELERYPQPAHRQLAFAAVEAGASVVIGHHPHCVGGFELYKNCPIAYSLGNWWFPQGEFIGGKLAFPDYTLSQAALEWEYGRKPIIHWFAYSREDHSLSHTSSEVLEDDADHSAHTPFAGLSHREYQAWFRKNRVKRRALPVYDDYRSVFRNWLNDVYIAARHPLILLIKKVLS